MKLYSIILFNRNNEIIDSEFNLISFGYFERSTAKELIIFSSRLLSEKNQNCNVILDNGSWCYCYTFSDKTIVMVSDKEYPERYKRIMIKEILYYDMSIMIQNKDNNASSTSSKYYTSYRDILTELINKDIYVLDKIGTINNQIDENKKILTLTIEGLLERGEKLDSLIEKSNDLSYKSKTFYKQAKKNNTCCVMF
jgi:synaptobrevin family protein YKT6